MNYTPQELMVVAAARKIRDYDVVFVGMRLPLLAFQLAKVTHAPNAVSLFENGLLREIPASDMIYTMGDIPNQTGASWATTLIDVMALLQRGEVDVGFLGGAQVDRFGNLNTTWTNDDGRKIRLPGSGGACDIAALSKRVIILMNHESRRFVERVDYVTSPGFGTGGCWRQDHGLPGGGPSDLITSKAMFAIDADSKEWVLTALHPGASLEEIEERVGWPLNVSEALETTAPPSEAELAHIRAFDPHGFWTGRSANSSDRSHFRS